MKLEQIEDIILRKLSSFDTYEELENIKLSSREIYIQHLHDQVMFNNKGIFLCLVEGYTLEDIKKYFANKNKEIEQQLKELK